jgi:hypothetical protein
MVARMFTIISEFSGTTNVIQVSASGVLEAAKGWARQIGGEMPFGPSSSRLAEAIEESLQTHPPTPVAGMVKVWCLSALCEDQLCLANIVETNPA